jgi:hypothetical protein
MRKPGSYLQQLKKGEDNAIFDYILEAPQESRLKQEFDIYFKPCNFETSPSVSDYKRKILSCVRLNLYIIEFRTNGDYDKVS